MDEPSASTFRLYLLLWNILTGSKLLLTFCLNPFFPYLNGFVQGKKPFHCDLCGFCRVGGQENFRHCSECCMCISINVFETHRCFKDKYKNNCPVCREDMFSSRQSPQDLPCGHAIHAHCFRKLAGFDYRCPICKKTVVSQQSMAAAWEARARDIAEHPMPSDLQRIVDIMCNDCETKSHSQNWHFLGIQCGHCSSFNTVVEQVISSGGDQNGQANANVDGNGNNGSTSGSAQVFYYNCITVPNPFSYVQYVPRHSDQTKRKPGKKVQQAIHIVIFHKKRKHINFVKHCSLPPWITIS